jgi:hypothetical protein
VSRKKALAANYDINPPLHDQDEDPKSRHKKLFPHSYGIALGSHGPSTLVQKELDQHLMDEKQHQKRLDELDRMLI